MPLCPAAVQGWAKRRALGCVIHASHPYIMLCKMCFSRFCLLSDLTYVHCSTLDSEFDQIAAELEGAEREEKDEESGGEESAEVCGMRPSSEQSEYLKQCSQPLPTPFSQHRVYISQSLARLGSKSAKCTKKS